MKGLKPAGYFIFMVAFGFWTKAQAESVLVAFLITLTVGLVLGYALVKDLEYGG